MLICKFCGEIRKNANARQAHEKLCKSNPNRQINFKKPKGILGQVPWNKGLTKETDIRLYNISLNAKGKGNPHSEETKQKLSKIRKEYLLLNPDKVPYKLNHYSKGSSYPETYFREVFKKENLILTEQYQVGLYSIDFALIEKKIAIEIDGEQHYVDERISQSDIRRTKYLEELGWKIFRIRWSEYQKLDYESKKIFVKNFLQELDP